MIADHVHVFSPSCGHEVCHDKFMLKATRKFAKHLKTKLDQNEMMEKACLKVDIKTYWTMGTDCAGLGTDHIASKQINPSSRCAFASEKDPKVRLLLRQTLADELKHAGKDLRPVIYKDMTKRNLERVPEIDIYVAGPACQPWSLQGDQVTKIVANDKD